MVGVRTRRWLRRSFPRIYARFGRYFHAHNGLRRRIVGHARRHPELYADPEMAAALQAMRRGVISVFSFPGCEKYDAVEVGVHVDADGFPWVDHGGRRLYFRRGTDPDELVRDYRRLLTEQDAASPHCYRRTGFDVREGDVLLDVGAAEGIFALDNIERVSRAALFEVSPEWVGALERTFAPWSDKVAIINKFASDADNPDADGLGNSVGSGSPVGSDAPGSVTIDSVVRTHRLDGALFLKLDVEGAEERVLAGAAGALARPDTRAVVCTYHRAGDLERLSERMCTGGFEVVPSGGWMLFVHDRELQPPFFRRGVIYCRKTGQNQIV